MSCVCCRINGEAGFSGRTTGQSASTWSRRLSCSQAHNARRGQHDQRIAVYAALPKEKKVVIVGAGKTALLQAAFASACRASHHRLHSPCTGLAGLSCGLHLQRTGTPFTVLEASDGVGGRVRTDKVDGFLLDRGFQIFLTSYEEAQAVLDYSALNLQPFYAGALVHWNGAFHRVADPLRHPLDGVQSLPNPIGSPLDKVNVGLFRTKTLFSTPAGLLTQPETTTLQRLQAEGFSQQIIQRFFQPFLGGIFFDTSLQVTSRLFTYVMRCLATGSNCLPAQGIGAVSDQLAHCLPANAVHLDSHVQEVRGAKNGKPAFVRLRSGETITADAVVVATDGPQATHLLSGIIDDSPSKPEDGVGTSCLYYRAEEAFSSEPILYLNGEGRGIVNNATFLSNVASSYAPPEQALLSVSTIGAHSSLSDTELDSKVRPELRAWFGPAADAYELLRTYHIPFAQPNQTPPTNFERPVTLGDGLFVCGDHRDAATFNGALVSGRRAAEAVITALSVAQQPDLAVAA